MSKKSPQLRFEGFTDDWEQRKLESLCEVFTDGDWIEAKDQSNSGVRLIQTGNIGITEYLDKENNKKWISEETLKRLRCEEVYPGDILISRLPDPAGRACILPNLGIRMITAVDCTIIRTSKEYDSKYLVQYLSTPTYFKIVNSFLGGGTRQRISRKNLSKIDIPVPHIFAEQQKIGEYFSNLDRLITLHQRKLDLLKEQKKGFLQKMFPKNGEKVPELRFAGFADDWEERKLGELALVLTGFPFKNEDFVDNGKYLVITNGNIQNESSTVDVSLGNRVDDLSDEIKERYYLNKNDILVTMDGTVGRTAKVVDDNLILAQRVARLVANKNTEFVYQWLNQGSFFNEMTKVSHGGTIKHISLNEISNYSATVPSNNIEQQKIGSFFKQLDDTIALHQRKLDLLKEQKKGFLQKMFV